MPWADYDLPAGSSSTSTGKTSGGWHGSSSSTSQGHSGSISTTTSHTYGNHTTSASSTLITSTTTSSIATSTTTTASSYIQYAPVAGYFLQDDATTEPSGFDYSLVNFGLINQTYDTDSPGSSLTQWQRFAAKLSSLQSDAPKNVAYKLIFMGRHGEGNHNAMESYVGTPAWNCYWALLDGANSSFVYADAPVTPAGANEATKANAYWRSRLAFEKIQAPQSYYSSPMRRCLETAEVTFAGLGLIDGKGAEKVVVKEGLREGEYFFFPSLFPFWDCYALGFGWLGLELFEGSSSSGQAERKRCTRVKKKKGKKGMDSRTRFMIHAW